MEGSGRQENHKNRFGKKVLIVEKIEEPYESPIYAIYN